MEYGKSNRFPKHDADFMGAIIMCNNLTKKESFKRKLFGLPSVHSDFVKQIKTGMILFLFEADERKLNGIFQATSDGAMNIVPSAFSISKKCFPAQVRFERLCACRPLFENEFSEAIEENYITAIKFSLALSCPQVCRLIWLFSSRSYLPYDQLPGGLQSEFMKIFENSSLARTRMTGNENLQKFDAAGYNMDNNFQPTRNAVLLGCSKNHLSSYKNYDFKDITLQNRMVRGQREPCTAVSHSAKLQQPNQMLSASCNDLSREAIRVIPTVRSRPVIPRGRPRPVIPTGRPRPVIPTGRPRHRSRFLYEHHSVASGTDLLEQKLTFGNGSSLDAQKPHITNQSYASAPHIRIEDFPLTNYPGIDISKSSRISKPSQLTLHPPEGHVNFPEFSQKAFPESYDLSNNKFLLSPPGRLQAMASTSLCLRNARSYSQPIQQEDSWSIQDWPSAPLPDYIPPISEEKTLVNSGYSPLLEGDDIYTKEAFELPTRKENLPLALQHDHHSGFTSDTNNTDNGRIDFTYNDKNSASDLDTFPQSETIQKRCNVFRRLSRPPKKIKYPSLDRMVGPFYHQRSQWTKVRRQLENLESFETNVPLDNVGELGPYENVSLVEIKPQIKNFDDSNGFSIPNFKRRSVVKRQSIVASDFTGCVEKCKRRKIIRPSFSEDDNSSQVKENCQNLNLPYPGSSDAVHKGHDDLNISCTASNPGIKGSLDFRIDDNISKMPAKELSFSKESDAHGDGAESVGHLGPLSSNLQDEIGVSSTDSLALNIQGSQQTLLDFDSEVGKDLSLNLIARKSVAKESEKINISSLMLDENVDGKHQENSCALSLDFIPLLVEKEREAVNSSRVSTSNAIVSHELPEKDASKNTARSSPDSDVNHIVLKMDAQDFPPGIRCKTTPPDLVCEDNKITSDGFPETDSNYQC